MGASCGTLNCKTKQHFKYSKANIIKRPTSQDFSCETDAAEVSPRQKALPPADEARLGVYF